MSKYSLTANSPLEGANFQLKDFKVSEITNLSIFSIAIPKGETDKFSKIIMENYGIKLPESGKVTMSINEKAKFLALAPNQFFLLYDSTISKNSKHLDNFFDEAAYFTDQSDGWVVLQIEGKNVCSVLERICSINLSSTTFSEGSVTRTLMEHIGVILFRQKLNDFLLFSARSSAKSFYKMIANTSRQVI